MKVFFHTLGCKVNRYETECMREELLGIGFVPTENVAEADLIIINSCTVTAESDRKTRQMVRRYKRLNNNSVVLLTGCMPQAFSKEAEDLPADIILGNTSERNVAKSVEEFFKNHKKIIEVYPHKKGEKLNKTNLKSFSERTRAYMKIEDGCDRGCTYCIIPKARGRVRSRSLEEIYDEAKNLAAAGFKEVVLVGINLSSFGLDIGKKLYDAVLTVAKVDGIKRIRLGSLEPDLTDDETLLKLKGCDKFCPQFHLSLQSGDDDTLKRMNRLYNTDFYKSLTDKIKKLWCDATITTDIMVGFIGETQEEFENSLNFAKNIGFLKAHVFPYSVREGTFAANMPKELRVDETEKSKRAKKMAEEMDKISLEYFKSLKNTETEVLFERQEDDFIVGHAKNFLEVFVKASEKNLKSFKTVKIIKPFKTGVLAEIVE